MKIRKKSATMPKASATAQKTVEEMPPPQAVNKAEKRDARYWKARLLAIKASDKTYAEKKKLAIQRRREKRAWIQAGRQP